ncbi:MAG TPA: hypothetical protein DCE41_22355 [Cytophagales bacterium]|nr:hypothetical protein [Cytophagales bacterium]HAA23789.1 hypothetical protein [Cytophagales bacterium]
MLITLLTPTPNLEQSVAFYESLDFQVVHSGGEFAVVTDGKAVIEINPDRFTRAGVRFYGADVEALTEALSPLVKVHTTEKGALLADPTGTWIYLEEAQPRLLIPSSENSTSVLGNFVGISLETTDMDRTVKVWEALGFSHSSGAIDQGWITLTHPDGLGVSVMPHNACPHLFFNPSLTYFNSGKNPEVIAEVRKRQIPITEEITHFNPKGEVDNIIIRDPGGYGFFVFND